MASLRTFARVVLGGIAVTEGAFALQRWQARRETYDLAARRAAALRRSLVVVGDPDAGAHTRLYRAYGPDNLFDVSVQPWTLTATLYPGARWTAARSTDQMTLTPVSQPQKAAMASALTGLLVASGPSAGSLVAVTPRRWRNRSRRVVTASWWPNASSCHADREKRDAGRGRLTLAGP